jgi:predicted aldo/keto reductase-like oxidoreductase
MGLENGAESKRILHNGRKHDKKTFNDQAIIVTKIFIPPPQRGMAPGQTKEFFLRTAEDSLRRLKTDYIDVLYSHNVSTLEYLKNPGVLEALQLLKKQGKTRFIGFSTHLGMVECLNEAADLGIYEVVLSTFNYSYHSYPPLLQALAKAAAAGIGLMAMKTQCQADWYRDALPAEMQEFYRGPIIHPALLKWALRHEFITCAVPGFVNFQQLDEDWPCAFNLEYSPAEKKILEDRNIQLAMAAVCRQCGACTASCPQGAAIPELLRVHMYAFNYGNLFQARQTLDAIPGQKGLRLCLDCDQCRAACVNRVQIGRRIDQLKRAHA